MNRCYRWAKRDRALHPH